MVKETAAADVSLARLDHGLPAGTHPGRWDTIASLLCSGTVLGLLQAGFVIWRYDFLPDTSLLRWLGGLGFLIALLTTLVLAPPILLLRRWLPSWKRGDRRQATWSVALGATATVATWMLLEGPFASPLIPESIAAGLRLALAGGAGVIASFLPVPSARWTRLGACLAPVGLLLVAIPPGGAKEASSTTSDQRRQQRPGTNPADVVLITVDTLRADFLGAYGRSPSLTPALDQIAAEGVLFRRTLAASPWTVPSLASLMTGLSPLQHRAGMPGGSGVTFERSPLGEEHTTLAERFAAAGYRTRAVAANAFISPEMGLAQGFDELRNPLTDSMRAGMFSILPLTRILVSLLPVETWGDPRARGLTDTALEWLADNDDTPLFLWVHYIDPHLPYLADPDRLEVAKMEDFRDLPKADESGSVVGDKFAAVQQVRSGVLWLTDDDRRRIRDYYERGVRYVDGQIGRLFEGIRRRSESRTVVVAFTSDHGEELWDHGHFEHGHDYYREVTRVPLIFWEPRSLPRGAVVDEVVGLIDVGPTLLELTGLEAPTPGSADEGRSLVPAWTAEGESPALPPRFSGGNLYDLPGVLVADGPWRYILRANGTEELYQVLNDPAERDNLAAAHPDVARRLRELAEPRLAAYLAAESAESEGLSPEALEGLRALGYVG